ncbi:MAG: class II aldolase/adducin family protein [Alphaproteobacteria bacterium]|nr:class II aldolase/adducin family protein [Alphaproteobacteria bacterium]
MSATAVRLKARGGEQAEHWQQRVDLAAAFRLAAEYGWHEAVANHFSLAVSDDGKQFLINPRWRHFSRMRASELLLCNADDRSTLDRPGAPDPSAWSIHGALHRLVPHARCVLHLHPKYGTTLAALADPSIPPLEQNCARFYRRVAIDLGYGGLANNADEGVRIAEAIGPHRRMMLGNHGVLVVAPTVAEAFDDLYYLERAARTVVLAYSTGRPLNVMPHELAEHTAKAWENYPPYSNAHFAEMKQILDAKDASYAT